MKAQQVSFSYKSPLKDLVARDAYDGKLLKRNQRTLEHILPHSHKGPNELSNYLIASAKNNGDRGNMPFTKWLTQRPNVIKHIQNYLDELRGLKVNGTDYVEVVKRTLNREAKGKVVFRGKDSYSYYSNFVCNEVFKPCTNDTCSRQNY